MISLKLPWGRSGACRACAAGLLAVVLAAGFAAPGDAAATGEGTTAGAEAAKAESPAARDDLIGAMGRVAAGRDDSFVDMARDYGLGYVELMAANPGVDPWLPHLADAIVIPGRHILPDVPREGIVINLAELRLYWFGAPGGAVETYPVGIGRTSLTTPMGRTAIVRKRKDPYWYPTPAHREEKPELPKAVPPGPDNPLGRHALDLGWPAYLIHGTNLPPAVGRRVSRGCVRMYPESVETLFEQVPVGTPVTVVHQAVKFGWQAGELYLEVHPSDWEVDEIEEHGEIRHPKYIDIAPMVKDAAGDALARVDMDVVERVVEQRRGIPVRITRDAPAAPEEQVATEP